MGSPHSHPKRLTPAVRRLSSIELKASKMITMSKDHELDFLQLVSETFDSVFKKYAFRFQKESIWSSRGRYHTTSAVKGDIELVFYLAEISEFCHLSIQIRVSGKSAEKVTSKTFRNISIGEIARRIDPKYSHRDNEIRTKQDLKEALEAGKECLLRYCEGILLGDVSSWLNVVNAYIEEIRKAGLKVE